MNFKAAFAIGAEAAFLRRKKILSSFIFSSYQEDML